MSFNLTKKEDSIAFDKKLEFCHACKFPEDSGLFYIHIKSNKMICQHCFKQGAPSPDFKTGDEFMPIDKKKKIRPISQSWSLYEEIYFCNLLNKFGPGKWGALRELFTGKTERAMEKKFCEILDFAKQKAELKKKKEEDAKSIIEEKKPDLIKSGQEPVNKAFYSHYEHIQNHFMNSKVTFDERERKQTDINGLHQDVHDCKPFTLDFKVPYNNEAEKLLENLRPDDLKNPKLKEEIECLLYNYEEMIDEREEVHKMFLSNKLYEPKIPEINPKLDPLRSIFSNEKLILLTNDLQRMLDCEASIVIVDKLLAEKREEEEAKEREKEIEYDEEEEELSSEAISN